MHGVIIARPASPAPLDAWDIDAVERELKDLVACGGQQLVLDFEGISGISSRLVAVLVRVHAACKAAGGRLKLCNLCPELASAVSRAGMDQVLEIMPDASAALREASPVSTALRPLPVAPQEEKVSPTAEPRLSHPYRTARTAARVTERPRRHATAFDETVYGWLAPADESSVDSLPVANELQSGLHGPLEAALRDRSLGHRFLLDVLVLDPHPRRLESDPVMKPIRRVLTAVREQRASRRVVIDLSHVVSLSAEAAASLADQAIELAVAGGTLRLTQVRPAVMEAIRQSRLGRVTKVYPTVDEAVVAQWD